MSGRSWRVSGLRVGFQPRQDRKPNGITWKQKAEMEKGREKERREEREMCTDLSRPEWQQLWTLGDYSVFASFIPLPTFSILSFVYWTALRARGGGRTQTWITYTSCLLRAHALLGKANVWLSLLFVSIKHFLHCSPGMCSKVLLVNVSLALLC